jgi:hypothetical protein
MVHSLYYCKKVDVMEGGKLVTKYPIELDGTAQTVSKNRIGGLPSEVSDTKYIIDAYSKWGVVEETSVENKAATEEPKVVDDTLGAELPTGNAEDRAPYITAKDDPIAAIMG